MEKLSPSQKISSTIPTRKDMVIPLSVIYLNLSDMLQTLTTDQKNLMCKIELTTRASFCTKISHLYHLLLISKHLILIWKSMVPNKSLIKNEDHGNILELLTQNHLNLEIHLKWDITKPWVNSQNMLKKVHN